jgi:hypothetical protein
MRSIWEEEEGCKTNGDGHALYLSVKFMEMEWMRSLLHRQYRAISILRGQDVHLAIYRLLLAKKNSDQLKLKGTTELTRYPPNADPSGAVI